MKKRKKKQLWVLMAGCLLILSGILLRQEEAGAATEYKELKFFRNEVRNGEVKRVPKVIKSGKYYLKAIGGRVYISTHKGSGYKITPIPYREGIFSNGKQIYYVEYDHSSNSSNILYKYLLDSRKRMRIKILYRHPELGDEFYGISMIRGSMIYLSQYPTPCVVNTYMYNTKNNKLSKMKANFGLSLPSGNSGSYSYSNYVLATDRSLSEPNSFPITLYKIDRSGNLQKVRKLSEYGLDAQFIGNKLYYTDIQGRNLGRTGHSVSIYRCNVNGSKKKKIATFKINKGFPVITIFTEKSCIISDCWGGNYKYTYATKRLRKL